MKILVTGAGGFIGDHLVRQLKADGHTVYGLDLKAPTFRASVADEFVIGDLRRELSLPHVDQVYHLAADMGGIEYITNVSCDVMLHNTLMTARLVETLRSWTVRPRVLFTSSACVYPLETMDFAEDKAYPANPDSAYGWEKLHAEHLLLAWAKDDVAQVRIARLHNVYGPYCTYEGGREKSPAALCRKIAKANDGDAIDVWGDGTQLRTYCYIDDCVRLLIALMNSDYDQPLNIGSSELVSVNTLASYIMGIAGKTCSLRHRLDKPIGVTARWSDNARCRAVLHDEPTVKLYDGLRTTYEWIASVAS